MRTPLPRLVSLSVQRSCQERRWFLFSMASLPQPKWVTHEQNSANFSLMKSWGTLAWHGLVILSHTAERSCHKPLHSLEFEHTWLILTANTHFTSLQKSWFITLLRATMLGSKEKKKKKSGFGLFRHTCPIASEGNWPKRTAASQIPKLSFQ